MWQVEYTDQFEQWWDKLSMEEQAAIDVTVEVLQERGPGLGRPHLARRRGQTRSLEFLVRRDDSGGRSVVRRASEDFATRGGDI
jgi:hypothetical protein